MSDHLTPLGVVRIRRRWNCSRMGDRKFSMSAPNRRVGRAVAHSDDYFRLYLVIIILNL